MNAASVEREPVSAAGANEPTAVSTSETLLTLFGAVWLLLGLFIDGYAHSEIIDTETEDFFTAWHAIFYSGFLFSAVTIVQVVRLRTSSGPLQTWVPPGYGLALVGLIVFAVGGVGDLIWHTALGIETGLDALLSPTHLLLFAGLLAILSTAVRSAWLVPGCQRGWPQLFAPVVSVAITTALVAFFFEYAFGLTETWPQQVAFDANFGNSEEMVANALGKGFIATTILVGPAVYFVRRWHPPRGAVVAMWVVPVVLESIAFDKELIALPAVALGAVSFEVAYSLLAARTSQRGVVIGSTFVGVATLWSSWMLLVHVTETVRWPPELWLGQIVMNTFVGIAIAALSMPRPLPVSERAGGVAA